MRVRFLKWRGDPAATSDAGIRRHEGRMGESVKPLCCPILPTLAPGAFGSMQDGCCALRSVPLPPCGEGLGVGVVVISLSCPRGPSTFGDSFNTRHAPAVRVDPLRPICTKSTADMSSRSYCDPHPQPLPTRGRGSTPSLRLELGLRGRRHLTLGTSAEPRRFDASMSF